MGRSPDVTAPREHRIASGRGDICWFEWGTVSDCPSLFLLHATGFHARLWDQIVAELPPGTHVIAPDHRGHGRSFRPSTLADWSTNATVLLPLVDQFAGQAMIGCGHSMGGHVLTRLATLRPDAFRHIMLVDPVILAPEQYRGVAEAPIPDPRDHPVARRRNSWGSAEEMRTRFSDRPPYNRWEPRVLVDYCEYGLLRDASGERMELACPPTLEASMYQNSLRTDPHEWLGDLATPVTLIRAPSGARTDALDFSLSPTWPALGEAIGAEKDELWDDCTHFIPMEAPVRLAKSLADLLR